MTMGRSKKISLWLAALGVFATAGLFVACSSTSIPSSSAIKIGARAQLIGGQRALGDIGDYKLSNGIVHAVIQEVGRSRGPGAFGGSLIDVDLVRGGKMTSGFAPAGSDAFTEMFPAFFLQAVEPSKVEITADGSDGGPAIIRVSGRSGDFLSMLKNINNLVLPSGGLDYAVEYILEPGKQYLKIVTTVTNPSTTQPASFALSVPFGFVTLLSEGQNLFVPGQAGFDMRFHLEEVYKRPSDLEALPGEVAQMVVTQGDGVSYGLAADEKGANYLRTKPSFYPTAKRDSLLVPVSSGPFLGTFWGQPPAQLEAGKSYSYTGYLAVGSGDVASVQKVLYDLKGEQTGVISGIVREQGTNMPLEDMVVVVQDSNGNYVSSAKTEKNGQYSANVTAGKYRVYAHDSVRTPVVSAAEVKDYAEVSVGGHARVDLKLERPAYLSVSVRDETGRAIPAKVTVQGKYDFVSTAPARSFLYNLKIGERQRQIDLVTDEPANPDTRRYIEKMFYVRANGRGGAAIRANKYRVFASRGMEYDLAYADVELKPGKETELTLTLKRVMPTPGYISGDFHVHSINSVDSHISQEDRVASFAVEGVEYLTATDHNSVSDLAPVVEATGMRDWVKTAVGIELTTIEMGHFNAFPITYEKGPVNHGSFNWFYRPPGELFAGLRSMATPNGKIPLVQVNHPRDGIMGYFNAFNVGGYTGKALPPSGTIHIENSPGSPYEAKNLNLDFDVYEVFNGKHLEALFHYRIPAVPGPGGEPTVPIPPVGEILEETVKVPLVENPTKPEDYENQQNPVYPGTLDDYYMFLSQGREYTATGNSDTHGASSEPGQPKTYLYVGDQADGPMSRLTDESVVVALEQHRGSVTNGPFIELSVNDKPMGSRVYSPDGTVTLKVKVQAAPWVDIRQVVIRQGYPGVGKVPKVVATIPVAPTDLLTRYEGELTVTNVVDRSFFVAETSGENDLWPVIMPTELPSVNVNEAVSSLAGSFGFEDKYGKYTPDRVQRIKPFAFTNPIWVDRQLRQSLKVSRKVMPLGPAAGERSPREIPNLLKLFGSMHGH
jgi:hypothetical protein